MKKSKNLTYSLVLALTLGFIGGILETYSLFNRGYFALMQTGNLISIFTNLIKLDWNSLGISLIAVFSFIIGLIIANLIEYFCIKRQKDYHPIELFISAILLSFIIFVPVEFNEVGTILEAKDFSFSNVFSNVLLSLIGAFLLESFRKMNSINFTSTMMTANLQRMVHSLVNAEENHDKKELVNGIDYLFLILTFSSGVCASFSYYYFLNPVFKNESNYLFSILPNLILVIPIILIFIILVIYLFDLRRKNKAIFSE